MRRLVFFPDSTADPLWEYPRTGHMVNLDTLPVSRALKASVRAWAARWDVMMRGSDYGATVIEPTWVRVAAQSHAEGRELLQRLRDELSPQIAVGWVDFSASDPQVQWASGGPAEPYLPVVE